MQKRKLRSMVLEMRTEMKRRILMIHKDQDRSQGRMGDQ